jgi:AAA+ ATPase superfamily predicted ATPase
LYLSWWDQNRSVAENLTELAGRAGAPLITEGQLVMATEVGSGEHTAAVLSAIAAGHTRNHEIQDAIGTDPTRTLDRLIELRIIERMLPVTEDGTRSRRRVYRITDNYLAFYLGPLSRFRAEIERGLGRSVIRSLVRRLDGHMGAVYEEAFREHLRRLANEGSLGDDIVAVGSWWKDDGQDQIDAVVLAEPDLTRIPVLVGECKWATDADGTRIKNKLIQKAARLTKNIDDLRYCVCARQQVHHADPQTLTITAADIFSA